MTDGAARSRPRLSIRARLTVAIMALTGVVSALAVVGGLRAMAADVRDRAVDDRVEELTFGGIDFEGGLSGAFSDGLELDELDAEELGEVFGEDVSLDELGEIIALEAAFEQDLAREAQLLLIDLAAVGLDDQLFESFADSAGNLNVLLFDGSVAVIPPSLTDVGESSVELVDGPVLPIDDLQELWAAVLNPFETETGNDAAVGDDRQLEVATVQLDGVDFGLLVDTTDELSTLDAFRAPLWWAAAALTALAGLATWFLTGRALRPVADITDRVAELTSGTLDGRVPESGTGDEIGVLARTMNRMLERLERSDRQRRQFVSDASHELRTPLAVLRSEAEVARRAPDSTTVTDFGQVVIGETARLEALVEDLLALARADERKLAGARTADPVEVDVDDVVLAEAERTRRLPVDRSSVSAGRVVGRPDDLARAVGHLLDNAARHGNAKVAVGVATQRAGARNGDGTEDTGKGGADRWPETDADTVVRIWVDDDGAGIPEEDRAKVFDRFHRLDEARSRDRGGSGLGLAVVAETAAAMGGRARVGTSPLGGARFELVLPAAAD